MTAGAIFPMREGPTMFLMDARKSLVWIR